MKGIDSDLLRMNSDELPMNFKGYRRRILGVCAPSQNRIQLWKNPVDIIIQMGDAIDLLRRGKGPEANQERGFLIHETFPPSIMIYL
jgi:hypothetical protein